MSSGKLCVCLRQRECVFLSIMRARSPGKYQTSRAVLVSAYTCVHPRILPQKASNPTKHMKNKTRQEQTNVSCFFVFFFNPQADQLAWQNSLRLHKIANFFTWPKLNSELSTIYGHTGHILLSFFFLLNFARCTDCCRPFFLTQFCNLTR